MKTISLLFAALAAAGCAASPYGAPYSIIEVERVRQADAHVIPLIVNRVDDVTSEHNRYMVVAPGRHLVTVDVPPRKGFRATQNTFPLDTEPCTRYYLAARLATLVTQEWTPIVTATERIGECEAKFATAGRK